MPAAFGPLDLQHLRRTHPEVRIIDVRTPAEFGGGHIAGSYNVPLPDLASHRAELTSGAAGPVVLVCQSGRRAELAEQQLTEAGLAEVHVLAGGVEAWKAAGNTLTEIAGTTGWSIERQVRGVAGSIVFVSIAVSTVVPEARFVAGAVGAGLVFAAVSNTCAMGNLLGRLPWNRRTASCDLPALATALTTPAPTVSEEQPA